MVSLIGFDDVHASACVKLCNSGVTRHSVLDFLYRPSFFSFHGNDYFRSLFYLLGRIERGEIRTLLGL